MLVTVPLQYDSQSPRHYSHDDSALKPFIDKHFYSNIGRTFSTSHISSLFLAIKCTNAFFAKSGQTCSNSCLFICGSMYCNTIIIFVALFVRIDTLHKKAFMTFTVSIPFNRNRKTYI